MYKYKFVKIPLSIKFATGMNPDEDYHQVIEGYASEGWRLVQIFAPAIKGAGYAAYYELIFEKELESKD